MIDDTSSSHCNVGVVVIQKDNENRGGVYLTGGERRRRVIEGWKERG